MPFADVITYLFLLYVAAYLFGFAVGGSRYFKWIAGIAAGLFFVSFGIAAGEREIGGGFVLFLIAIPLLGWSVPFALGGGLRRFADCVLPRAGNVGRVLVATIGLIGPLALVFAKPARVMIERQERAEQTRLAIAACEKRGISGTLGGFNVQIPIAPQIVLGVDGGVRGNDEAYSLGWSHGWQGLCMRDTNSLRIRFLSVHQEPKNDAKWRWFREKCSLNGGVKGAPLCSLYADGVDVMFNEVPLGAAWGRTQAALRLSESNEMSSKAMSEDGITILSKTDKGRIVARLDGAEGIDRRPVLIECFWSSSSSLCRLEEQIAPAIVREFKLHTSRGTARSEFERARLASDRLFAEITAGKSGL